MIANEKEGGEKTKKEELWFHTISFLTSSTLPSHCLIEFHLLFLH